ncbi:MAG: hypothetical protein ISS15_17210 [Alphaproteobacteria bacterium]|nr:hypothetical protein [Alphaproteobacteria bacterium]MBL6937773.1 hypothetical protein [Alphaproteobacteria bacterium]MBL7099401.1 hypothetical protein [Alphaproteobacteria bacterium]
MARTILIGAGLLFVLLLAILFLLPLSLPRVGDIVVTGVELSPEVPKPDRDGPYRGMDGPFLGVTFTSAHDFQKLAHDWHYTLGYALASCAGDDLDPSKPLASFGGVYDQHGPVFMYADKRHTSGPGTPFRYHVYLAVRAEPNLDIDTGQPQPNYDLKAHPQDVCLRIDGLQEVDGDGWGFAKFKSNVVRIAKDDVTKAFR